MYLEFPLPSTNLPASAGIFFEQNQPKCKTMELSEQSQIRKIVVQVDDLGSVPQWVSEREPLQKNRYGLVKDVSKAKVFDSEIEAQRAMMEVSLYSWRDDWDRCL